MQFLTDRKRATGLGTARSGTAHHWSMMISSAGLIVLVPIFVFLFGTALGSSHEAVVARFSQPFPAIVALLTIWAGMMHFRRGAQMMIEDYWSGMTRKILLIAMICLSYTVMAAGLYAIVRIAI